MGMYSTASGELTEWGGELHKNRGGQSYMPAV